MDEHPDLAALRARLDEEERAYVSLLAALDGLAALPVPAERLPELPEKLAQLNRAWELPGPPDERGLSRIVHHKRWELFAPVFQRQTEFNSTLVQILNGYLGQTGSLPKWNFAKYLVGKDGKVIQFFDSKVTPEDKELRGAIDAALVR